jgi:oligopeptidase B
MPKPPVAARKPHEVRAPFGATRQDEYYWMRDDPEPGAVACEGGERLRRLFSLPPPGKTLFGNHRPHRRTMRQCLPAARLWYYSRFEAGRI